MRFLLKKSSAHVWKTARHQLRDSKADTSQIAKLTVMFLLEKSSAHVWKTARHQLKKTVSTHQQAASPEKTDSHPRPPAPRGSVREGKTYSIIITYNFSILARTRIIIAYSIIITYNLLKNDFSASFFYGAP